MDPQRWFLWCNNHPVIAHAHQVVECQMGSDVTDVSFKYLMGYNPKEIRI